MSINSIGDLARGFALQQQSNTLKQQISRLTEELSSGVTSDSTKHLSGNFSQLTDVKHKLALLETHRVAAAQGRTESSTMQSALDRFQSEAGFLSSTAITLGNSTGVPSFDSFANEARGALGTMLSALNVSVGGRSLFAGDAVTGSSVAQLDDFIAAISAATAGATTASDINTALDSFFDDPGGGYDTLVYQGGSAPRASYPLGDGESVTLDLRADDPVFKAVLKQVSIAAILDDPNNTLTNSDQVMLTRQVGETLLNGQNRIVGIQADLGFAESRIDRAATRISSEISGLNMINSDLLSADPFEAATELETAQIRLETLYTLTSRMSRLSLVNFLS